MCTKVMFLTKTKTKIMMSFIIDSSVPDQVDFVCIYNYLPILYILYFINTQKTQPEVLILFLER